MYDVRTMRLRMERQAVLRDRFDLLNNMLNLFYGPPEVLRRADRDTEPNLIDLALTPSFRAVWDAPGDGPVELTTTDPANISASIEFAMKDWRNALKMQLIEKLHAAIPELASAEDPLSLAIAGFSCRMCEPRGCGRQRIPPLRFPEILAHPCLRASPHTWSSDLYVATASALCDSSPLLMESVTVNPTTVQNMRAIMEALRLDPLRTTLEELNSTEARLCCTKCQYAPAPGEEGEILVKVQAFDWMRAVRMTSPDARCKHANCDAPCPSISVAGALQRPPAISETARGRVAGAHWKPARHTRCAAKKCGSGIDLRLLSLRLPRLCGGSDVVTVGTTALARHPW